ncbi:hypothetical protein BASA81_015414 [Batrachochytrium salamandrivorans]|nr:hypothetical protein BASA81_015414 [Batrachochytrium salamandrivorans]
MGIQGLLPELKAITQTTRLADLSGLTCGVDTYSWIHRGVFSCATDICLERETSAYIAYCNNLLSLLLYHQITPILVFDGHRLLAKQHTELEREAKRELGLRLGKQMMSEGREKDAHAAFSKAVDVTAEMARKVLQSFQARGVECIVAPYESDAQLAKLARDGKVNFVISEDSDLLAFGCNRVLYKLDRHTGRGEMVDLALLSKLGSEIRLFSSDQFLDFCILAGCDYLDSVRGVGVKRAMQLVAKYKSTKRILRGLRTEYDTIPKQYELGFYRARLTFQHQVVYCSLGKRFVHLCPLPTFTLEGGDVEVLAALADDWSFVGKCDLVGGGDADAVWAKGDIHPDTLQPFPKQDPSLVAALKPQPQQRTLNAYFTSTTNPWVNKQLQQQQQLPPQSVPSEPQPRPSGVSRHFAASPTPSQPLRGGPPSKYGKIAKSGMFPMLAVPPSSITPLAPPISSPPVLKKMCQWTYKQ